MKKDAFRKAAFISIAVVLFAVAVAALHHHLPSKVEDHDCEICSFIMVFSAAIAPVVVLFLASYVLCGTIIISKVRIHSEKARFNSSRAPPFILL
jgi:hypothetical protein